MFLEAIPLLEIGILSKLSRWLMHSTLSGLETLLFQTMISLLRIFNSTAQRKKYRYCIIRRYKYLIINKEGDVEWEAGPNRFYSSDETPTPSTSPVPTSKAVVFNDGDFRVIL